MSRQIHPPWFDYPNNIWWSYRLWSSSLCSLRQPRVTSLLRFSTLFSNNLSLCSSLNVTETSHSHKPLEIHFDETLRWASTQDAAENNNCGPQLSNIISTLDEPHFIIYQVSNKSLMEKNV
jgi:hypothetical protein